MKEDLYFQIHKQNGLTMCISAAHWREHFHEQIHLVCGVYHY